MASEAQERVRAYGLMNGEGTTFLVDLGRRPSLLGVNQPLKTLRSEKGEHRLPFH